MSSETECLTTVKNKQTQKARKKITVSEKLIKYNKIVL